jgi:hypothetical protein
MKYPINRIDFITDVKFHGEVIQATKTATQYLLGFDWCREVIDVDLYLNLGATLCIFLLQIDNVASSEDNYLWVIVGDIPSMYLDIHGPSTTTEVIEDYIQLAEDWTENVKSGNSLAGCYPFNAAPTFEMAELLEKRVAFMKEYLD